MNMATYLLLIRHAERDPYFSGDDTLCPISQEGKEKVLRLAAEIKKLGLSPTRILASPTTRTIETANTLNTLFNVPVESAPALSLSGNYDELFNILPNPENNETICLIGHFPTLATLFTSLTGQYLSTTLKTACGVVVQFTDIIAPGTGKLIRHIGDSK